jgi:acetyltransferase-like isoleucine patch superfamily enzyme
VIGAGTVCTYDVVIQCTTSVEIGERCMLAHAVTVVDGSHRFRDLERPVSQQGYDYRPIKIGDDVSIMANATVINDVESRAFIGANAVVTRPIPAYTVAVGVPARVAEYFGPEQESGIDVP